MDVSVEMCPTPENTATTKAEPRFRVIGASGEMFIDRVTKRKAEEIAMTLKYSRVMDPALGMWLRGQALAYSDDFAI